MDKNRSSSGASARIVKPSFENQRWVIKKGSNSFEDTGCRFAEIRTQTFRLEDRVTCIITERLSCGDGPETSTLESWMNDELPASSVHSAGKINLSSLGFVSLDRARVANARFQVSLG